MDTKELSREQCITLVNYYALAIAQAKFEISARHPFQKEFAGKDNLKHIYSDEWQQAHPKGFMTGFNAEKVEKKQFEKSTLANMRNTLSQRRKQMAKLELELYKLRIVYWKLWPRCSEEFWDCKTKEEVDEGIALFFSGD